jgi:hypothetical protein
MYQQPPSCPLGRLLCSCAMDEAPCAASPSRRHPMSRHHAALPAGVRPRRALRRLGLYRWSLRQKPSSKEPTTCTQIQSSCMSAFLFPPRARSKGTPTHIPLTRIFCVLGHVALCVVYSFPAIKLHHVVNVNPRYANYLLYFVL